MKTTLFGILALCILTGCSNSEIPGEQNMPINSSDITTQNGENSQEALITEEEKQELSEDSETPTLVSETVIEEDILDGETLIGEISPINSELSEIEVSSLLQMREEEKLARDVYLALYDMWGQQIFSNIATSEQTHTDAVKTLLEKYGVADPVTDDSRGVFTNPVIQGLYDTLVAEGSPSLLNALIVGATVEDLDIKDIQDFKTQIDNEDILLVYDNLERGSRNHLRSFTKNIQNLGGSYEAQYISAEEYEQIITSETERGGGMGMQKGK